MAIGRRLSQRRLLAPLSLTAVALFLSFWQRPHLRYSDQRIELITDPLRFLSQVGNVWSSTIDLGHIQTSQFVGYLFPMGPFFAIGDAAGIPIWLVQRVWIAAILALGAWGVARLVERLYPARSQSAPLIAGLIFITAPFITIGLNRGTSWLLAAALLPWLLLWTAKGIDDPRGWRAPAAVAVLLAAAGGGLNAAVVAWLVIAVALFGLFEAVGSVGFASVWRFAWRAVLLCLGASLWWVIPVIIQARYGANYLTFTEHAEAILHTPSASESLRLLGYWVAYINGYPDPHPQLPAIGGYLLSAPTIIATFAIPAIAIASLLFLRRWRYGAFFALLLGLAVLAMSFGFPQQSQIGRLATDIYYGAGPLQFMRTTYKAAPLAALAIACLAGVGLGSLLDYLRSLTLTVNGVSRAVWPASLAMVVVIAALTLFWGRPLWAGNAIDPRLFFSSVPAPVVQAIDNAQTATPSDSRIAVIPGELFGWYTWGGTQNSVVPGLSAKPVLVRQITRPATEQAAQLLDSVDARIQQGRLTPGQLPPLLQLMGVGRVLVATDSSPMMSEALDPARVAAELSQQPGFKTPAASFGPVARFSPPPDRGGPTVRLPDVRAYAAPKPASPRISRVHPAGGSTVVDGDAEGIIAMAAVGTLNPQRASFYAADLSRSSLNRLLPDSPTLTFTDSNRRHAILGSKLTTNTGPTLGATDPLSREFPSYDPFPEGGASTRTVAVYNVLSSLYSPATPGFTLFPEHRPFAAFDGHTDTAWLTEEKDPAKRYLQATFREATAIDRLSIIPANDSGGETRAVFVSVNGGPEQRFRLHYGSNTIRIANPAVKTLRLRVPGRSTYFGQTPGGLAEVRIPGVRVTEALRLPTRLATIAAGRDLSHSPFDIVTERVTADFPRRVGRPSGVATALDPLNMVDAEPGIRRIVTLPAARTFTASGWASVTPAASDSAIDTLAGVPRSNAYDSSARFEGVPINRASSAFDQNPRTAWISEFTTSAPPWIRWTGSKAIAVKSLVLRRLPGRFLKPTNVNVATPAGGFDLKVRRGGVVVLPRELVTRSLKVTVTGVARLRRTVRGARVPRSVALSELSVAGVPAVHPRRSGPFSGACGAPSIASGGRQISTVVSGNLAALDAGAALRLKGCGTAQGLRLLKGANLVAATAGRLFAVDSLRLHSSAPAGLVGPAPGLAAITPSGKVALAGAGWLVLGQSYSPGWRAWCRDSSGSERELGAPVEIDGYANGWRINGSTCSSARFEFGPQQLADVGYWISGLIGLALLLFLLLGSWNRRGKAQAVGSDVLEPRSAPEVTLTTVAGVGLAVSQGAEQAGAKERTPRGPRAAAWLFSGGAVAVVIVCGLYVLDPGVSASGVNFDYSIAHTSAHWVALVAVLALVVGALTDIVARRRGRSNVE